MFEFEDQPWFPSVVRDGMTDYLKFVSNRFDFYKSVVPILVRGLEKSSEKKIVDLASGAGGGWLKLAEHLIQTFPKLRIVLTDRFPNHHAFSEVVKTNPEVFEFMSEPVDARQVPTKLKGLRTQFLSLHHFKPIDAKKILQNAVDAGQPIAIFEAQKRDLSHIIKFAMSPIAVVLLTPLIRPFKWNRLILTYLIPVIPLFTLWDGLVSVLRTYSLKELEQMTCMLRGSDSFNWEIGESNSDLVTVTYLLGYPS